MLIFQLSTGNLHAHDGVGVKHTATNLLKHGETNQTALGGVRRQNCEVSSDGHATKELRLATDVDRALWNHAAGDDGSTPDTRTDTSLQQLSLGIRIEDIAIPLAQVAVVLGVAEDGGNTDVVALDGGEAVGEGSGGQVAGDVDVLIGSRRVIANGVHDREDLAVFLGHDLSRAEVNTTFNASFELLFQTPDYIFILLNKDVRSAVECEQCRFRIVGGRYRHTVFTV